MSEASGFEIAMGGMGNGVTLLRHVPWLTNAHICYWGDLDVDGLLILSAVRAMCPHAESAFMDEAAISA